MDVPFTNPENPPGSTVGPASSTIVAEVVWPATIGVDRKVGRKSVSGMLYAPRYKRPSSM